MTPEIDYVYRFFINILAPAIGLSYAADWILEGENRMLNLLRQFVGNCPPLLGPGDDSLPEHNTQLLNELRETGIAEDVGNHDTLADRLRPILNGMDDEEYIEFMSDVMAEVILSQSTP